MHLHICIGERQNIIRPVCQILLTSHGSEHNVEDLGPLLEQYRDKHGDVYLLKPAMHIKQKIVLGVL